MDSYTRENSKPVSSQLIPINNLKLMLALVCTCRSLTMLVCIIVISYNGMPVWSIQCDNFEPRALMFYLYKLGMKTTIGSRDLMLKVDLLSNHTRMYAEEMEKKTKEIDVVKQEEIRMINKTAHAVRTETANYNRSVINTDLTTHQQISYQSARVAGVTKITISQTKSAVNVEQSIQNFTKGVNKAQCLDGWVFFKNSCYLFSVQGRNFTDAAISCQDFGGHLVYVDNGDENNFLKGILATLKDGHYWMGLTDEGHEGSWLIYNSNKIPNFFDWYPGQPDNSIGAEHCAHFWSSVYDYRWNDEQCPKRYFFICEREL